MANESDTDKEKLVNLHGLEIFKSYADSYYTPKENLDEIIEASVETYVDGKDYATKDDLKTVEGTATEALQKATDLEETANIGMRLCFNSEGYPCVEYLISEV